MPHTERLPEPERLELVALAKEWISGAPEAQPGAPDLKGFAGPIGFICSDCSGRLFGRGCNVNKLATEPVWDAATEPCAVCEKQP